MKKLVYIVFGIFLSALISENVSFIYAEDNTQEFIKLDKYFYLNEGNLDNTDSDYNTSNENYSDDENQDGINTVESNNQPESNDNLEFLPKSENKQIFEVEQTEQYIDTSSYGIIRVTDPENSRKGITIHDRNLGAVTTGAGTSAPNTSYGYYYQWGNNYGFPTTGDIEKVLLYSETNIDASDFGLNNPYSSDTFIKGGYDWSHTGNDNLRGGIGDNENNGRGYPINNVIYRQGPCPSGYHVPSIGEWSKLLEFWAYEYTGAGNELTLITSGSLSRIATNNTASTNFYKRLNIPLAGQRDYDSSSTNDYSKWGLMWSSSPENSSTSAFRIFGEKDKVTTNNKSGRAGGSTIRCFLDSYRLPIIVTYDINGGYWSGKDNSEKISLIYTSNDGVIYSPNTKLPTPQKESICGVSGDKKCMFAGWYLGINNDSEMRTGNINEDITLYAKWLEFDDEDISISGVNFTVIDRNLGAIKSGVTEDSYGYYLTGGDNDILCPEGYHIPSTGEWLGIGELLGDNFNGDYIKNLLNLPFAGKFTNIGIIEDEDTGYYLATNSDELMYAQIKNSGIQIENLNDVEKVSVRCFKNYNTGTIKFYSNGGNNITDITAVNWRENGEDLEKPSREHSIFSGWYTTSNFQDDSKLERNINYKNEEEINLHAKWDCEEGYQINGNSCEPIYFDIQRIDGNGNIIKTDSVKWGETPVYNGTTPTKSATSNYSYTFNGMWIPEIIAAFENTGYIAQFNEEIIKKSGGNSSGGGGRKTSISNEHASPDNVLSGVDEENLRNTSNINYLGDNGKGQIDIKLSSGFSVNNAETSTLIYPLDINLGGKKLYSQEFIDAYIFAYKYGITTARSIKDARVYSPLTRIEMAKMLSYYAINVLGKKPDVSKGTIKFGDVTDEMNAKYNNGIVLAYQLGIMGQNMKDNKFRPNDEVTRAEFVTALSRLLYGIEDGTGIIKYYEPHSAKLYNEGIINNINSNIKEKKGYVMIMMMRSLK